jgi:DNA-binding transcriptional MerR regulator
MLKIGEFAKLSRVSIKTLRYYDKIGLVRPDVVDINSGYRFYTEAQLLTIKRINIFKEQGFTLGQISLFLEEDISQAGVKSLVAEKQAELRRLIQESENQLDAINERLHRAEVSTDAHEAEYSIALREVNPMLVASIREIVPITRLCVLLDEVSQYVRTHGETQASKSIVIKHSCDAREDQVDLEVALPISTNAIPSSDRVRVDVLSGLTSAASLVHRCDPYDHSCLAVEPLSAWIEANGYSRVEGAPIREVYMTPDEDIYGRMRLAEMLIPVSRTE